MTEDPTNVEVRIDGVALLAAAESARAKLVADQVASLLTARDAGLWGVAAAPEAKLRLGWLDAPTASLDVLPRLAALRASLASEGLDHVVLCGMGGSSLAPEVICKVAGVPLTVLDSSDPLQVAQTLADRLDRSVVVVSSKSGGTVETDSHRRAYRAAFAAAGLTPEEVGKRFIVVTDPGSPLAAQAEEDGVREIFLADPHVGGRYSALTAFGLVPAALAGADVAGLLADAEALLARLAESEDNPGLALGAVLGGAGLAGRDKVFIVSAGDGGSDSGGPANSGAIPGFGDWAEQLIAESTGKDGRGLLPVVTDVSASPAASALADGHLVTVSSQPGGSKTNQTAVSGPLGAQFLVWEYAVALAGRVLGINPFDQPDVESAKTNTRALLDAPAGAILPTGEPAITEGPLALYADPRTLALASTVGGAIEALLAAIPTDGYLAVMAYLNRSGDLDAPELASALRTRTRRPVTFGWGPRFLHSTGQFHKGGPPNGVFLQITGDVPDGQDLAVPGREFTFGRLQLAQALGDRDALLAHNRPVLRVHLRDRNAGLAALLAAIS